MASTTPADLTRVAFIRLNASLAIPATPAMMVARINSESLSYAPTVVESPELDPSGQLRDSIFTGSASTGAMDFPLVRSNWFHAMLAAVFRNEWGTGNVSDETSPGVFGTPRVVAANELIPGRLLHMYAAEKRFETPSAASYHLFNKVAVTTLTLRIAPRDILSGTVALEAADMTPSSSPITGATYPDPGTYQPFTSPNVTEVDIVGSTGVQCFSDLTLAFNSNIRGVPCVGEEADRDKSLGRFIPSFDGTTYFTSNDHIESLRNQEVMQIYITLTDGSGNAYRFFYPRAKFVTAPVTTPGTNADVMQPISLRGHYSPMHGYSVMCTRVLAP